MWNQRYDRPDYLFGTEPAQFVRAHAHRIPHGAEVLCVADGEGRNSVYLAKAGYRTTAFDPAANALLKARKLAEAEGVSVDFNEASTDSWDWVAERFDAVAAIFIQFATPAERAGIFAAIARTLVPGGVLLLHGYAPRQVGYGTGGPPFAENMYTLPLLHAAFPDWPVLHEADYDAEISEGEGHSGRSGLIDFVARKPG